MLDDILELIIEIALEGAIEASGSKKKAVLIGLAALVWLALAVLLLWVGITEHDVGLITLAVVLLAALIIWLFFMIKRYQAKRSR